MRDLPIPKVPTTRLPTPKVQQAVVVQPINLRPYGNTVAVTSLADNPFEGRQRISVVTQASGGSAKPDPMMQSRRLMHDYLPGIGEEAVATPVKPAGVLDFLSTVTTQAGTVLSQREQAKIDAARAEQMRAQAAEQEAKARRDAIAATWSNPTAAMATHAKITVPLLIAGGVALAVAGALFFKKKRG